DVGADGEEHGQDEQRELRLPPGADLGIDRLRHQLDGPGTLGWPATSDRICSTRASASSRLLAVIPSSSLRHGCSRSATDAGMSVTSSGRESVTPNGLDGMPRNTATLPSSTPTYHWWSTYTRTPTQTPATSRTSTPVQIASRPHRNGRRAG